MFNESFLFRSSSGRPRPSGPDSSSSRTFEAEHPAGGRFTQLRDPERGSHTGRESVNTPGSVALKTVGVFFLYLTFLFFPDYPDAERISELNGPE